LVSGAPGTGKSSIGASFVNAACARGERALLFAYEESPNQLYRNMRSIGMDLQSWERKGLMQIHASRPSIQGLEFRPAVVLVDPISNLSIDDRDSGLKPTLMRLVDALKQNNVTAMFTSLTPDSVHAIANSELGVSSLMDTWLLLANLALNGERTRTLQVLKSRGMPHSNQIREFVFTDHGVELVDVYFAGNRVLTGTARVSQKAQESAATELRRRDHDRRLRELANHRKAIDAQIAALHAQMEDRQGEVEVAIARENLEAGGAKTSSPSVPQSRRAARR
jgi:circadian clock protein KaiC